MGLLNLYSGSPVPVISVHVAFLWFPHVSEVDHVSQSVSEFTDKSFRFTRAPIIPFWEAYFWSRLTLPLSQIYVRSALTGFKIQNFLGGLRRPPNSQTVGSAHFARFAPFAVTHYSMFDPPPFHKFLHPPLIGNYSHSFVCLCPWYLKLS